MMNMKKKFILKRLVLASAIMSMAALLGGCGKSNSNSPTGSAAASGSAAWGGTALGSGCAALTQQIGFQGSGIYDGVNFLTGNVPINVGIQPFGNGGGTAYGSAGPGSPVNGAYGAQGIDGTIRLNLNSTSNGQGNMNGYVQLSQQTIAYIQNVAAAGQLPGITVPTPSYSTPFNTTPTATNICVSAIAITGGMRNPAVYGASAPYAVRAFLYLNNTQVWYQAMFSNQ